ncbi:hypothetical protein D3C86_2024920 [compost metagenome]
MQGLFVAVEEDFKMTAVITYSPLLFLFQKYSHTGHAFCFVPLIYVAGYLTNRSGKSTRVIALAFQRIDMQHFGCLAVIYKNVFLFYCIQHNGQHQVSFFP